MICESCGIEYEQWICLECGQSHDDEDLCEDCYDNAQEEFEDDLEQID